ncbi:hypothetical protein [Streptomyces sp. NPDC053541]|uniref:hypothetical protein n=1 Tax=Streptomyces sp. NPDC053541 TaxID=3365709 RepID=UPI0037D5AFD3
MAFNRNYSLEEAAELLGCAPRFLEDNLRRLPHQKLGKSVAFDDDELMEIKNMHRVRPTAVRPSADNGPRTLAQIRPKGARAS